MAGSLDFPPAAARRCLGLLALAVAGCGEPLEHRTVYDLVERLATETTAAETMRIDLGTETARSHLAAGWSRDERTRTGDTFVWATGESSEIGFHLLRPRDLTLSFRLRPYQEGGIEPGTLTLSVNGHALDEIPLERGTRDYEAELDADWLLAGANRLRIRHAVPSAAAAGRELRGGRPLSAAWFEVRLDDGLSGGLPGAVVPARAGSAVALPWGARVDYHLELPEHAALAFTTLEPVGDARGRLEVTVQMEGGIERDVGDATAGDGPASFTLLDQQTAIARVSLRAVPASDAEPGRSGLLLVEPRIEAPAAPAEPAPAEIERSARGRPNIVIYLVDTLRADRLGCYGHTRPVSPALDRFASRATLFERAVGNTTWTRPAVASLFTGLWPAEHGVVSGRDKLSQEAVTLAELLSGAGYSTASIVANPNAGAAFGLDQGFQHHVYRSRLSDWIYDQAADWLEARPPDAPFLLYLHTKDPHDPYDPPTEMRERFAADVPSDFPTIPVQGESTPELIDGFRLLYDADIAFNDLHFGRLIELLERLKLYDDTLIVFLSDHGEEFQEHGSWLHGTALWAEQLNVPLIVKLPGQLEGARSTALAQQIDLLPTILDYLGLEPTGGGRSLLPILDGLARGTGQRAFVHLALRGPERLSVVGDRWKLIQERRGGTVVSNRLFDLPTDPAELDDVADRHPVTTGYLATLLQERLLARGRLTPEEGVLSPDEEAELRALGYLQ